MTSAIQAC